MSVNFLPLLTSAVPFFIDLNSTVYFFLYLLYHHNYFLRGFCRSSRQASLLHRQQQQTRWPCLLPLLLRLPRWGRSKFVWSAMSSITCVNFTYFTASFAKRFYCLKNDSTSEILLISLNWFVHNFSTFNRSIAGTLCHFWSKEETEEGIYNDFVVIN